MPYLGNEPATAYTSTTKDTFSGDASTTDFTLSRAATQNAIRVVVENVVQDPGVAYTCTGTTLSFTSAPPTGTNNIYVVHLGPPAATIEPPTTINNNTTFTGDLTVDTDTLRVDSTNNRVGVGVSDATLYYNLHSQIDTATEWDTAYNLSNTNNRPIYALVLDNDDTSITNTEVNLLFSAGASGSAQHSIGVKRSGTNAGDLIFRRRKSGGGGSEETMRLNNEGIVTIAKQPAFQGRVSSQQANLQENEKIDFTNEVFDLNADYNATSSTFTAPVDGKYCFLVQLRIDHVDTAANWVRIELSTSNNSFNQTIIDPGVLASDPVYWSFSNVTLAQMDAGDTAIVKWGQSSGTQQSDTDSDGYFSGYLVC